ncbi:MAG: gluconeogenesis factor YvcK family protein [Bacillota bacterium]
MGLFDWLKPGLRLKRWLLVGGMGVFFIVVGCYPMIRRLLGEQLVTESTVILTLSGIVLLVFAVKGMFLSVLKLLDIPSTQQGYRLLIDKKLYDKRILAKGPKIVVIGGGTGLSILLRGLKKYTTNITAIVTVADDGGGSGKIREDLGMLPPGDIRNCILALADTEPIMERLLQYRFEEGSLKGQSFGNLLIAAMNGISSNFEEAIKKINDVLAVTGTVLPVTTENVTLYAKLKNEKVIKGESQIPIKALEMESEIEQVFLKPNQAKALDEALLAIENADIIILGPGSLYTSVIPNLLVDGIGEGIRRAKGIKAYIANVMTQPGETDGYGVWRHIEAIKNHCCYVDLDYVFVNNEEIPYEIIEKYAKDGAKPVRLTVEDKSMIEKSSMKIIEGKFIDIKKQYVRHDAEKLGQIISKLASDEKLAGKNEVAFLRARRMLEGFIIAIKKRSE